MQASLSINNKIYKAKKLGVGGGGGGGGVIGGQTRQVRGGHQVKGQTP